MKSTAIAPSNIAFIKYWGRKNEELRIPENGSLSMNLSGLQTTTTVDFDVSYTEDVIEINGVNEVSEVSRASKHLDLIRQRAGIQTKAKVVTRNNFPIGTGLSSSASGFAALTVAASNAAGLTLSEKELTIFARQGSGSACRSIPDGFVEWIDGDSSETSYAYSVHPSDYWDIVDVVAVVSEGRKDVPTSVGQQLMTTSPFFSLRRSRMSDKLETAKRLLTERNFREFGELIEAEALEMHAVMITSSPLLIYWTPGTLQIMKLTKKWRRDGLPVYFTINTGQDIHLIVEKENEDTLTKKLAELPEVLEIISNNPTHGARLNEQHLF